MLVVHMTIKMIKAMTWANDRVHTYTVSIYTLVLQKTW